MRHELSAPTLGTMQCYRKPSSSRCRSASPLRRLRCRINILKCDACSDDQYPLAGICRSRVCRVATGVAALIRVEAIWLATEPLDMRAGTDTVLARVVFGAARPHHAYLFANKRGTRMKGLAKPF
ncbi:hypothetical protein D9M69_173500 [compost metagenome]